MRRESDDDDWLAGNWERWEATLTVKGEPENLRGWWFCVSIISSWIGKVKELKFTMGELFGFRAVRHGQRKHHHKKRKSTLRPESYHSSPYPCAFHSRIPFARDNSVYHFLPSWSHQLFKPHAEAALLGNIVHISLTEKAMNPSTLPSSPNHPNAPLHHTLGAILTHLPTQIGHRQASTEPSIGSRIICPILVAKSRSSIALVRQIRIPVRRIVVGVPGPLGRSRIIVVLVVREG